MLGTVIKHEWKSTWKMLALVNLLTIGMAVIGRFGRLGRSFIPEVVQDLYIGFYMIAIFASYAATFILLVVRFYKNLFTEQGYLTNTLPLTTGQKLNGKLINFCFWSVINAFSIIASLFIFAFDSSFWSSFKAGFDETFKAGFTQMMNEVLRLLGFKTIPGFIIYYIVLLIIGMLSSILCFYFCISIGCSFSKNKILASVLTYVILNVITSIVSVTILVVLGLSASMEPDITDATAIRVFHNYMNVSMAISVVQVIVYYVVTHFMMHKKLNLN